MIRVGRAALRAELVRSGRVVWAAEASYASETELAEALASLAGEAPIGRQRSVRVELDRPLVQVRTLSDLPPVRASALAALVANQAGRFFRRNGKLLVTDAAWERRGRNAPRVGRAAAVEEPWVDAIVRGAAAAGLEVDAITPVRSSLLLLPAGERAKRARRLRLRIGRLAAGAAALWALVGALAARRLARETAAVDRELARLRPTDAAATIARKEYDRAVAMIGAIEAESRGRAALGSQVARIVLSLPDSSFLAALRLTESGSGTLTGAARRAADVAEALDRTAAVVAPRLAAPPEHDVIGGREHERFTLRFGTDSTR